MYLAFIRGIAANFLLRLGISVVTSSFILFVIMEFLRISGILTNTYIGLITYLLFPILFIIGLLLIPLGWRLYKRSRGLSLKQSLTVRFDEVSIKGSLSGSRLFRTIGLLTLINILILGIASVRMLHFMDTPSFCGTTCHNVMNPEWTTYQQSPHARVKCVQCHVGEGLDALIDSKLNGLWQVISATFDLYERPIPTPVHNLRPARETCEKCHWPEMFHGNRIRNIVRYGLDRNSTPSYTTLMMKIGSGKSGLDEGSHWHVAESNRVRYLPTDETREEMVWVEVLQEDGRSRVYRNRDLGNKEMIDEERIRVVDCIDCHNRATHIYEHPERAVDDRIRKGLIDPSIPFIKVRALAVLTNDYPDDKTAMEIINRHIHNYYQLNYSELASSKREQIEQAVKTVQDIYKRNIHQRMNITWGSYPDQLGHRGNPGCFRCHNQFLVDSSGASIPMECTLCHSILAFDEDEPFKYLEDISQDSVAGSIKGVHGFLKKEFEKSLK